MTNRTQSAPRALCTASCNGLMIIWVDISNGMLIRRPWYPGLPSYLERRSFVLDILVFTWIFQVYCEVTSVVFVLTDRLLDHVLLLWLNDNLVQPLWHQRIGYIWPSVIRWYSLLFINKLLVVSLSTFSYLWASIPILADSKLFTIIF